jgi:hypothetical protein
MNRKQRVASCIAISSILAASLVVYVILSPRYLGIGLVSQTGGLSHISTVYTPNNNISYSVVFIDVNFTFLYWTYPYPLMDAAYTAYFRIQFSDNTTEVIHLNTGSYWANNDWPLSVVNTLHTSPIAGILYSGYLNSPVGWQFIVSLA